MSSILTTRSRVQRAEDFSQKNLYLAIGRTNTEWTDLNNPDFPNDNQTEIEELAFLKKLDTIKFVKPQVGGEIKFRTSEWTEVLQANIYTEGARYLYLNFILSYDQFPIVNYRQLGIVENPIESDGVTICSQDYYLASGISSQGFLHYVDNRTVVTRNIDQYEDISVIIEF